VRDALPHQCGDALHREDVSLQSAAGDHTVRPQRDVGVVPELLAAVDVGDVDLHHRQPVAGVERVEQADRGVRVGGGVDHDAAVVLPGLVDPVDEFALVVGLPQVDGPAVGGRRLGAHRLHVGEGAGAVDVHLAPAEQVQVGPVEDHDRGVGERAGHGRTSGALISCDRLRRVYHGPLRG
jgi:hypothetical protein